MCQGISVIHQWHRDRLGAGSWDPLLQRLHLDISSEQENTEKLYGTKNNSVHAQLGQVLEKKTQKDQKTQLLLLKSLEQKQDVGVKSRVMPTPPCIQHPQRGGQMTSATPLAPPLDLPPTLTHSM